MKTGNSRSDKILRWSLKLSEYDFHVVHLPRKANPSDALSRLLDPVMAAEDVMELWGDGAQVASISATPTITFADLGSGDRRIFYGFGGVRISHARGRNRT